MATKIRLQRHGKKASAFFHIVIADGRAPRDGKFIEKLGIYNPNTNPATIDMNFDRALYWLQTGAQPTDTARAILSYRGVIYKNHLMKGVKKGAMTMEQAEAKFEKWLSDKEAKIQSKVSKLSGKAQEDYRNRMAAEKAVKDAKAQKIQEKMAAAAASAQPEAEATAEEIAPAAEESAPEASAE
jgi:small subunit ribosomal protein S16